MNEPKRKIGSEVVKKGVFSSYIHLLETFKMEMGCSELKGLQEVKKFHEEVGRTLELTIKSEEEKCKNLKQ